MNRVVGDVRNAVNFLQEKIKMLVFLSFRAAYMTSVFDSSVNSTSLVECLPAATSVPNFVCLLCSTLFVFCAALCMACASEGKEFWELQNLNKLYCLI